MSSGGGCVHCSLLTSSQGPGQDEGEQLDMFSVTTFLVPGLYMLVLGMRWGMVSLSDWLQVARCESYHLARLPPPPPRPTSQFPWEGFIKIVLAVLASILTGSLPSSVPHSQTIIINVYIFFLLSGTTDLLVFYCGYSLLPEGLQSFILAASFAVEGLCYQSLLTPDSQHPLLLLLLLVISCSVTAALETVCDNRLVKFCRSYFTLLQSSWLVQLTYLVPYRQPGHSHTWISILFTWHAAGLFVLCLLLLMVAHVCSRPSRSATSLQRNNLRQESPTASASQLVPCKLLRFPVDRSFYRDEGTEQRESKEKSPSVLYLNPLDSVSSEPIKP